MSKNVRTFELRKLVRDEIVSSTTTQGGEVVYDILTGEDKIKALIRKLQEEGSELLTAEGEDALEELADIEEIIRSLAEAKGISLESLETKRQQKAQKAGSFLSGHFVHTITLPADNKWTQYYSSNPERFPEIK